MDSLIKKYNKFMSYLGLVCLGGFIISVLIQVISRTFLPKTPSWTEELARYLFIYMVAFGSSVAVHKKEFVAVDLIIDFLPKIIRKLIELVINIVLLLFVTFVLLKSVLSFAILEYRMVSTAMQVPMQYIYFSMIILFGLLILSFVMEILYQVKEILSNKGEKD
ncbi:TRAP transporter small permease [Lachnoanaerobaculum orale]|jgi:TRAP dicarboxylate transporter|uniref:TRAP transporter small permease n=1 Tax=Lachnoanaerobaculum orale TaxID=979627 RepID=A0A3P3Q9J6_9FIRM|nr:TRAP transporter small permease [Lachnoanaerobaculum orale]RRJ17010.1 TRAP transporter small permease [Lachnoanaerobaculum orale]